MIYIIRLINVHNIQDGCILLGSAFPSNLVWK
jgi:hypothetical protein